MLADASGFSDIGPPQRAGAAHVAHAVTTMSQNAYYGWLAVLYRLVLGFYLKEAETRKGVAVQIRLQFPPDKVSYQWAGVYMATGGQLYFCERGVKELESER